ncbi:unnamed protein product, partial [Ilex paraguariensis]
MSFVDEKESKISHDATRKDAVESVKKSPANMVARAKTRMDWTKTIVQEKAKRMTTHDTVQKQVATQVKEEMKNQGGMNKHVAWEHNSTATARHYILS